jgi:hypothetical protein
MAIEIFFNKMVTAIIIMRLFKKAGQNSIDG